jgi:hypothetical protein
MDTVSQAFYLELNFEEKKIEVTDAAMWGYQGQQELICMPVQCMPTSLFCYCHTFAHFFFVA